MKRLSLIIAILMLFFVVQGCVANVQSSKDKNPGDSVENGDNPTAEGENPEQSDNSQAGEDDNDGDLEEGIGEEEPDKSKNIVFVSGDMLNVREEPDAQSEKVGHLLKGSVVKVLEEKTVGEGEEQDKWFYISFGEGQQAIEGWISAEFTVADREDLLGEEYKTLDFSPQAKIDEYPENPRVKVKGAYMTIYSASGGRLDTMIEMTKTTGLNAFVIDVKDDNGNMLFYTEAAEKFAPEANKLVPIKDIDAFMKKLKDNDIYAIARIVTFKDPIYTEKYPERSILDKRTGKAHMQQDGLRWASAYDRQLWEYDVAVAKEAAKAGFNEIQFDYVRLPDSGGGKLDEVLDYRNTGNESKPQIIQDFLKYAYKELSPEKVYVSADIYGLVPSVADDMGLGQYWEAVSNVVDYVSPMMYPSHYANQTYNLPVPDAYPYETIFNCTRDAVARNENVETPAIIRPWIQDFTANWVKGHIEYGEKEVRAQIKALEENGVDEFMLWNPNNRYSSDALK
ncbi:MAG: SH3 domain-containing protein [Clostridiales bacterium]|nr:SH3 domain-containing protein [Clostridiales bacterium]